MTTVRPRTTTTTTAPEFSFDDSVPPPKLVNTGTDYAAILESLEAYGNWTVAHRPDPALIRAFVAPGSDLSLAYKRILTALRDQHQRAVETLGAGTKYEIISIRSDAFSAHAIEDIDAHQTFDASGRIVRQAHFAGSTTYLEVAVLVSGHWMLANTEVTIAPRNLP